MSLTIQGLVVLLLGYLSSHLNLPIESASLETTVTTIVTILGGIAVWYGRYRHGDITWYGKPKY